MKLNDCFRCKFYSYDEGRHDGSGCVYYGHWLYIYGIRSCPKPPDEKPQFKIGDEVRVRTVGGMMQGIILGSTTSLFQEHDTIYLVGIGAGVLIEKGIEDLWKK